MSDELRARLSEDIHRVDWKPLAPHAKRGALVMVAPELDLVEVGTAVAQDQGDQVRQWLDSRQLSRPAEADAEAWSQEAEERFTVLIVQPYVLAQRDFGDGAI